VLEGASCPSSCTAVGPDEQPWATLPGEDAIYPMVASES
jgi:hypothetical protein